MSEQIVIRKRGQLSNFAAAVKSGKVTMGYIGGSITEPHRDYNWPYHLTAWMQAQYPGLRIIRENAAIGGTGSLSGGMRCQEDLINAKCDIVFFEYAVNDGPGEDTFRTREGLMRQLLAAGIDVVMVYTFCTALYDDMKAGGVPQSIKELEQIAEHYNVSSVWMGLHAWNQLRTGRMIWEEWLPDNLHPNQIGSSIYADSVIEYLRDELANPADSAILKKDAMPAPVMADCWEQYVDISFDDIQLNGPWVIQREVKHGYFRHALVTASDGSSISFKFTGRALAAMFSYGKNSGIFSVSIDGGEFKEVETTRAWWVPAKEWVTPFVLAQGLEAGEHTCTLKVDFKNWEECKGSNCNILCIKSVL